MKFKGIVFLLVFLASFLLIKNNYDTIITEQTSLSNKSSKTDLLDSKKTWSERKQKIKGLVSSDAPDKFAELHRLIRTRDGETSPAYEMGYRIKEHKKAKEKISKLSKSATGIPNLNFIERGPANVGGRTRGIHIDPDDASGNTWFAASVGGGVWKTSDAGVTWELKSPDLPTLGMSYFGVSDANPDVIYVGTGEGLGLPNALGLDDIGGNGIFKSVDHGENWSQLESTLNNDFAYVNRLVVDPNNEDIVITATGTGIHKSIDGGVSWTEVYTGSGMSDLVANPLNPSTIYATQNNRGVVKSLDNGDTWELYTNGLDGIRRIEIDISSKDTSRIFVSADMDAPTIFMSVDAGINWSPLTQVKGSRFENENWFRGQGWYDNTIAAHPFDVNKIFYGGVDLWKADISTDSVTGIVEVQENGTTEIMDFLDKKLPFLRGGVGTGSQYWGEEVAQNEDYVDIEIRFGPGMSQKAHMFENSSQYIDFIDVPFEVWDITNNVQLAVSYNDLRRNDNYDLSLTRGDEIFVNSVPYDSTAPNANIGQLDGLKYKNSYALIPKRGTSSWDPSTHPESNIRILTGKVPVFYMESSLVTRSYSWLDGYGEVPDIHVDHHEIVIIPVNESTGEFRIINANDGGVAYSNDGGVTWTETDENGYNNSQFYGADKKPGASEYFGGMQDNGTWQSESNVEATATTSYNYRISGDGYETSWHYKDPNKLIGGSQYNSFRKSVDGGDTWYNANGGFTDWRDDEYSPFVSKIAKNNSDPDLLYTISSRGVWKSIDFGDTWHLTPIENFNTNFSSMAQVAISQANPQIIWAGSFMSGASTPHISKDGGFSYNPSTLYTNVTLGRLSGIDTHPIDEATAYATFSFANAPKILRTTNYGQSWQEITGFGSGDESTNGFPDVATYTVQVMPFNTDIIWAGTDIGIVESTDNGATWHLLDSNMPAVSIWEMKLVDDQIVIATHGRGIWSVTLDELSGYTPPVVTLAPRINGELSVGTDGLSINASLRSVYDSTQVIADDKVLITVFNEEPVDLTIVAPFTDSGEKNVYLNSFKDGKTFKSMSKSIFLFEMLDPEPGFFAGFHSDNGDFVLNGFTIGDVIGFSSTALQSPHPYEQQTNYYAILKTPIIVASSDALITYKDVAIIETGDPGTVFGDDEFWDYVIIEGSSGGEWIPLIDGYDASSDSRWLTAYNNIANGDESMFKNHTINLLDNFDAGDTVAIRFRLFSDPFEVGWGWLVDDLIIQGQFVGIDETDAVPTSYELAQNYPNPFNPSTTISFGLPQTGNVKINIYNSLGQLVKALYNEETKAGYHEVKWNANVASGIYYYSIKVGDFTQTKKMILLK